MLKKSNVLRVLTVGWELLVIRKEIKMSRKLPCREIPVSCPLFSLRNRTHEQFQFLSQQTLLPPVLFSSDLNQTKRYKRVIPHLQQGLPDKCGITGVVIDQLNARTYFTGQGVLLHARFTSTRQAQPKEIFLKTLLFAVLSVTSLPYLKVRKKNKPKEPTCAAEDAHEER